MLFVVTMSWPVEKTAEVAARAAKEFAKEPPEGVKYVGEYQLLGRAQSVLIIEAPDTNAIMQIHVPYMDISECDWAPAMPVRDLLKSMGM